MKTESDTYRPHIPITILLSITSLELLWCNYTGEDDIRIWPCYLAFNTSVTPEKNENLAVSLPGFMNNIREFGHSGHENDLSSYRTLTNLFHLEMCFKTRRWFSFLAEHTSPGLKTKHYQEGPHY